MTDDPIKSLLEAWKEDCKIDLTNPGGALLDIPMLHSKYLNILSEYRNRLRILEIKIKTTKKVRWEYYMGRMDEDTMKKYDLEPFPYILKSDVSLYIDSDEELTKLQVRRAFYEEMIENCISIMKELNSRTFQLKAYIDYEKFINGN
jgi:hypothetical protein